MKHTFSPFAGALICAPMLLLLAACNDGNTSSTTEQKTVAKDTVVKPRWDNPQKGKIWGKVNIVQIPLTAIENHMFGAIKSVRYTDYKISEKDGTKVLDDSGYNVYDKFGHLVDQNEYEKNGKAKWHCVYTYDDQNKATKWDFKFADAKRNWITTFKYDDKGRKIESNEDAADKERTRRLVYTYDDKGNEIEEAEYYSNSKQPWTTTYQYDSRGYQVSMVHKDENGRVLRKMTQEYDDNGNSTNGVYDTSDTTIKGKMTSKLDNKGRAVEMSFYKKNETTPESITKHKYDDWDNVTELMNYKADGSVDTARFNEAVEYEYDSQGNAVKETWYKIKDGKRIMTDVAERKFEYY